MELLINDLGGEITSYPNVMPPKKKSLPGRPKKKRRLEP